jgi:hypothetical protein
MDGSSDCQTTAANDAISGIYQSTFGAPAGKNADFSANHFPGADLLA